MSKNNIAEIEKRYSTSKMVINQRAEGEGSEVGTVEGYAALFDVKTEIGDVNSWGWIEVVERGAFDDVLNDDVRCLLNHDPNFVLARSTSGTLDLTIDEKGLKYSFKTPNVSYAKDLEENIRLGNVTQSSYAFRIAEEEWKFNDDGPDYRHIKKYSSLMDVSPVTYPAERTTEVSVRGVKTNQQKEEKPGKGLAMSESRLFILKNK